MIQQIRYRDGIIAGKEASAQEGFNFGVKESVVDGFNLGLVRGVTGYVVLFLLTKICVILNRLSQFDIQSSFILFLRLEHWIAFLMN